MNKDEIENIVKPVIKRHECYLWGIEILRGRKRPTLRVYIESEAGAGIDDCELVSKDLNYEAELELILGDDFILEVSTP
jgi:ribosome maturation factor RimP